MNDTLRVYLPLSWAVSPPVSMFACLLSSPQSFFSLAFACLNSLSHIRHEKF